MSITVGSLFCGMGGFALAFKQAGADVLWSNELDRFACQTLRQNFRHKIYEKDIRKLGVLGDSLPPVDILTAGFPCQPFSIAGTRQGFNDNKKRGTLLQEVVRIVKEFGRAQPKMIILENVRHLLEHDRGQTFQKVKAIIQNAGYWFDMNSVAVLNTCVHTDIPQNRERVFMVAFSRKHFEENSFDFPAKKRELRRFSQFVDRRKHPNSNFYFTSDSQYYQLFVDAITTGSKEAVYQLRRNFVRENKSGVCFTLTANMGEGGHNVPVVQDRWGIRKLTPEECLGLQGYSQDDIEFPQELSNTQRYKQIGNSVTLPLVREIASEAMKRVDNENRLKLAS